MNRRGMLSGLCGLIPGLAMLGLPRESLASTATKIVGSRQHEYGDSTRLSLIKNLRWMADGLEAENGRVTGTWHPKGGIGYGVQCGGKEFALDVRYLSKRTT